MKFQDLTFPFTLLVRGTLLAAALVATAALLSADTPPKSATPPDELIFLNGERLLGRLERSDNQTVVFKSEMAGEVKVSWTQVKQLHSANVFAVIPKGFTFGRRHEDISRIPQGHISVDEKKIAVAEAHGNAEYTLDQTGFLVDQPTFVKSLERPNPFADWKGSATAGVSLVLATQDSRTYTSAISLVRSIPTEPWMKPENRTILNFSSSFGELTQPGEPINKTSIFHADAERDEYFTQELYSFAQAGFDHNYSLGLDLQQTYGAGLGWSAIKGEDEAFDLKGDLSYVDQNFHLASQNQHLVGSIFSESYRYKFKRRAIELSETLAITPAWSNTRAYSANGNLLLTIPVAKHISVSLSSLDTFLNDPSPGFRKNSFQFSTGLTYTLP